MLDFVRQRPAAAVVAAAVNPSVYLNWINAVRFDINYFLKIVVVVVVVFGGGAGGVVVDDD